jgi:exopolysaccharide biosynthesis WecB/TagA/CpsF family protein
MLNAAPGQNQRLSNKSDLGGIAYSSDTSAEIYHSLCAWMRGNRETTALVGYVNPHVFNFARVNPLLREFLAQADIVTVDGIGVVLGLLLVKAHRVERTVMTPLLDRVLATDDLPHLKAMLIGGSEAEANRAANAINRTSTRIEVVEARHGYSPLPEYLALLQRHQDLDLVLVGMGTPRSEELLLKAKDICPRSLCWAVGGGTIQYYAGTKRRVPALISTLGLQWVYRMLREPRTAPRYFFGIPAYFWHLLHILLAEKRKERPR